MSDQPKDKDTSSSTSAPDVTSIDKTLKTSIKSAVNATNSVLANLQNVTDQTTSSFASRLQLLSYQIKPFAQRAYVAYLQRESYGPQIISGMAVAVGGLVGLRRGRVPGVVAAGFMGSAAYLGVYGLDDAGLTVDDGLMKWTKKE